MRERDNLPLSEAPVAVSIDRLGALLIDLKVITRTQWAAAVRQAAGPGDWAGVLSALRQMTAWWAPSELAAGEKAAGLSTYQFQVISRYLQRRHSGSLASALRLNDYLILEELGRGGMGIVFKAWDLSNGRLVALKTIKQDRAEYRWRLSREAEALRRLNHPAIARLLGVEQSGQTKLLVMEYIRGHTVHEHVKRLEAIGVRMPWQQAVRWIITVLDALDHAHRQGVVHRDIKPANLMVVACGDDLQVRLLDLGLAKGISVGVSGGWAPEDIHQTVAGQMLGTHEYMPPEQWAGGKKAVAASDIYALGGTLFFLLTARPPFPGLALGQVCIAHHQAPRPSVQEICPEVPAELSALIQRMMAIKPAQRGSPRELSQHLQRLLSRAKSAPSGTAIPSLGGRSNPSHHKSTLVRLDQTPAPARPMTGIRKALGGNTTPSPLPAASRLLVALWRRARGRSPSGSIFTEAPSRQVTRLSREFRESLRHLFRPRRSLWHALLIGGMFAASLLGMSKLLRWW
jgi:serine/threonine protein kinase